MLDPNSDLGQLMAGVTPEKSPDEFTVGDIVLLKSGSVPMTVDHNNSPGTIKCVWMTPSGELHKEAFDPALLEHADQNEQHVNQQKLTLLNLQLNIKKLEGFESDMQKKKMNLESPMIGMPRKRR